MGLHLGVGGTLLLEGGREFHLGRETSPREGEGRGGRSPHVPLPSVSNTAYMDLFSLSHW